MHEHLDDMGIIHMNGRIYDPLIGRFMSADPYIQDVSDLQSYNRYSYVRNNPMNLTDPSGYSWLSKTWKKAWHSPIFKAVLGIVAAIVAPYALAWIAPTLFGAGSLATALATGALSGFASTGTLKGALTGAFTAGLMYGVGTIGKSLTEAGVGGFTDGGNWALGTAKAAMLGGIGSKIGGGKFADGASTGAFGYIFNTSFHSEVFKPVRDFFNKGMENLSNILPKAAANVSTGVEVTGMLEFAEGSYSTSQAIDLNGNACFVQQGCAIVGAELGISVTNTYQLSSGSLSNGAENGVGLAAFAGLGAAGKLAPFQLNFDGNVSGQAGFGKGAGAGGGLKYCRSITKC